MRSGYDKCVYILKRNEEVIIYLLLYNDDIFMTRSSKEEIDMSNKTLNKRV